MNPGNYDGWLSLAGFLLAFFKKRDSLIVKGLKFQRLPKRKGGEWRMGADAYMHEAMNAVTRTIYRRNHGVQSTPQLADVIIALL